MKKTSIKQKIFILFVVPLILIFIGLVLSWAQLYREKVSFLSLTYFHNKTELVQWHDRELLKGDKIVGRFTAKDNYLGMVRVRFDNLRRINDDFVDFRIREESSNDFFYKNRHKVDQFQPGDFFPFGFPEISDSKGKIYIFEIESESGVPDNAIRLDPLDPVFSTVYKYPRSAVFGNTAILVNFPPKKIISFKGEDFKFSLQNIQRMLTISPPEASFQSSLQNIQRMLTISPPEASFQSSFQNLRLTLMTSISVVGEIGQLFVKSSEFIFKKLTNMLKSGEYSVITFFNFLPLIIYFTSVYVKLSGNERRRVLIFGPILVMILETILLRQSYDIAYITGILLWLIVVFQLKLAFSVSAVLGFLFLILTPILEKFGLHFMAIKTAGWTFFLFTLTTLQLAWNINRNDKELGLLALINQLKMEIFPHE